MPQKVAQKFGHYALPCKVASQRRIKAKVAPKASGLEGKEAGRKDESVNERCAIPHR